MSSDFVTIATCRFEPEAEATRLLLEHEGIETFVGDANAVMTDWLLGSALGYIKVQVPRDKAAAARDILNRHPRTYGGDNAPAKCLACGAAWVGDADRCAVCGWTYKLGAGLDEPDAEPGPRRYEYIVPYEPDIQAALNKLRQRVFESSEYSGNEPDAATPQEAVDLAGAGGTRSILDITRLSNQPAIGCAAPLTPGELQGYFGTDKPTRDIVQQSEDFRADIAPGQARYVVLYDAGNPTEILFTGCSID